MMATGQIQILRSDMTSKNDLVLDDAIRVTGGFARESGARADPDDRLSTVTELARELGITARALRFYEDKGLITPRRAATTRVYTHRERARMILILRGKRLGFSLREIKDYLDLYDADPKRVTQTRALLKKIEIRAKQLEEQKVALDQALVGLKELEHEAREALAKAERLDAETKLPWDRPASITPPRPASAKASR